MTIHDQLPYRDLESAAADLADQPLRDEAATRRAEAFLYYEARLLDAGRLADWLTLWRHDGIWWIPIRPNGPAPAREQSLALDDRRRLGERVGRFSDPAAWAHRPRSRTVRAVSNVEAWPAGSLDTIRARSVLTVDEMRGDRRARFSAHQEHVLVAEHNDVGLGIQRKAIFLIDADHGTTNPAFLL